MKVSQLEKLYKDGMNRLKGQKKRQEQDRQEQTAKKVLRQQSALYEKKLQDMENTREKELQDMKEACEQKLRDSRDAQCRELRLVQEELERITDQAVSLRRHIEELLEQEKE